jgi:hypothetical protein
LTFHFTKFTFLALVSKLIFSVDFAGTFFIGAEDWGFTTHCDVTRQVPKLNDLLTATLVMITTDFLLG